MQLIRLTLYRIVYTSDYIEREILIEADSFAEAERLAIEQDKNWNLKSISKWYVPTYIKPIKTVNIKV